MSSFPLTFIFFRGVGQPPTRWVWFMISMRFSIKRWEIYPLSTMMLVISPKWIHVLCHTFQVGMNRFFLQCGAAGWFKLFPLQFHYMFFKLFTKKTYINSIHGYSWMVWWLFSEKPFCCGGPTELGPHIAKGQGQWHLCPYRVEGLQGGLGGDG